MLIRLYCSGNSRFLKSIVYTAYTVVYPLATHYFGNSANSGRSLFSSASAYAIAQRLRYGTVYGVMCSALKNQYIINRGNRNHQLPIKSMSVTPNPSIRILFCLGPRSIIIIIKHAIKLLEFSNKLHVLKIMFHDCIKQWYPPLSAHALYISLASFTGFGSTGELSASNKSAKSH